MPFVQFRVHPGVGCARFGNSEEAYHLASEFPYFMQEAFATLRFKPKPRFHPRKFFTDASSPSAPGDLATYQVFDSRPAFQDKFKETDGKVFAEAARFRIFAYVFDEDDTENPQRVFEVTPDLADITWKVNIANKKSVKTTAPPRDPHENLTATLVQLDTAVATLECKRLRPVAGLPNLAFLFLERDEADRSKVTGRLHVIGNEGEVQGSTPMPSLWSDNWYDAAGDGSVEATIRPKSGGAPLRTAAGATSAADLEYLDYAVPSSQPGTAATINAVPGWVVIGCPDYVPDMGHFVSLWDVGFSRALSSIEARTTIAQPGKHKLITDKSGTDRYKKTDYQIHIHPQLCLFEDVRFVSGEAIGQPERGFPGAMLDRGHNKHPGGAPPAPDPDDDKTRSNAVGHGGVAIDARTNKAALADPKQLKDPDPAKPINDWLKIALRHRLRKPGTLYEKRRKFITSPPGGPADQLIEQVFPRKLGRRMDYDRPAGAGSNKGKHYAFPHYLPHKGNLQAYHGLADAGSLCGGAKSPPTAGPPTLPAGEIPLMANLDDMYWPATFSDMPMLRELAYTVLQYEQFTTWQAPDADVRMDNVFDQIVAPQLASSFTGAGDHEAHFAELVRQNPRFAPTLIDLAHLGAMLGGSFLPGIEVGREAGIPTNWCLYHGSTRFFPDVRFKLAQVEGEHTLGTLTKDLAVPWSKDYAACDEKFWPTARPGVTTKTGVARHLWLIRRSDSHPHLGRTPANEIEYVKEYWKALGFIRRDASDRFVETEQSWH